MNTLILSRWSYAALGLPLAMVALPVYVQTPKLYGDTLGINLSWLGIVLFVTRVLDCVQDPWLGRLSDRLSGSSGRWRWLACLMLSIGLLLLFNPPIMAGTALLLWLTASLLLVFASYSLLQIDYLAWGGNLGPDAATLAQYSGAREAASVVGVILASTIPALLALRYQILPAYSIFSLMLVAALAGGAWISFRAGQRVATPSVGSSRKVWANIAFRRLAALYLINCLANALPATLVLFFIADVLELESWTALFLLLYFGAALAGIPVWMSLMRRWGLARSWQISLVTATLAFCWTLTLDAGDGWQYGLICLVAGLSLGGDLALPPALLAHTLEKDGIRDTGPFYGWWILLTKASLALAAGFALPLLDLRGYAPGGNQSLDALTLIYAGLPCLIKIGAALLLPWCIHDYTNRSSVHV